MQFKFFIKKNHLVRRWSCFWTCIIHCMHVNWVWIKRLKIQVNKIYFTAVSFFNFSPLLLTHTQTRIHNNFHMFTVTQLQNYFKTSRKHFTEGLQDIERSGADGIIKLSPKKEFVRKRMSYIKPFVSRRNTGQQSHKVISPL